MDQISFFEAIVAGFQKTNKEVIISLLTIFGLVFVFFLTTILYKFILKKRKSHIWTSEYNKLIRKHDLTINEIDLLDELAHFLIDENRKILLLKNDNTLQFALSLLEKKLGRKADFANSLTAKLFGEISREFPQRPVRLFDGKGKVYSGRFASREGNIVTINETKLVKTNETSGAARLFIQSFKGIMSHGVSAVEVLSANSLKIHLLKASLPENGYQMVSNVFLYVPGKENPVETSMKISSGGQAIIENPRGLLSIGLSVKVSFRTEIKKIHRVNAIVLGISFNKKYAKLKLGYIKDNPLKQVEER